MEQTVETIIKELATASSLEESPFQYFETSQEQNFIPTFLIYLAGLVISTTTYSSTENSYVTCFTDKQEEIFREYQNLYHKCRKTEDSPNFFHSSPRILPTENQQVVIDNIVKRKRNELERQSDKAAQDILETWTKPTKVSTIEKKKKKKKSRQKSDIPKEDQGTESNKNVAASAGETRSQVLMAIQNESSRMLVKEDDDSSSWIAVQKKSFPSNPRKMSNNRTHDTTCDTKPTKLRSTNTLTVIRRNDDEVDKTDDVETEETSNHSEDEAFKDEQVEIENTKSTSLEDRVLELERLLQEKDEELLQERENHTKLMSKKNFEFDNQIQALQLRLYISETKLKTYQDALQEHMEKVSSNIASNDSVGSLGTKSTHYSSPAKSRLSVDLNVK